MSAMNKLKALAPALLTMLLWGSLYPTVKLGFSVCAVESTADILLFAGLRFAVCGAIICIFAAVRDKASFGNVKGSVTPILISGLFAIFLHYGFSYIGLSITDSSRVALLKQTGALFYVCFSFIFIKNDKPSTKKICGAVMGFLGVGALNITAEGLSFSIGDLLILFASFCTVFSNVISKRLFERVEPITATGISQLFGGIALLAVGKIMGGTLSFTGAGVFPVLLYICIASVVSYCIWYGAVKRGELSKLFIVKFSEPVFACVIGAIILGEDIWRLQYLAAFLLICGGIVVSNVSFKKKSRSSCNEETTDR